jgi:hypothetical protein
MEKAGGASKLCLAPAFMPGLLHFRVFFLKIFSPAISALLPSNVFVGGGEWQGYLREVRLIKSAICNRQSAIMIILAFLTSLTIYWRFMAGLGS